jgi:hypothetical protein
MNNAANHSGKQRFCRLLGAGVLILAGAGSGLAQTPPAKPAAPVCPSIERLVWKAPQRITWQMAETPLWFSLGHPARVLCWIPLGVAEQGGRVVETVNGSGTVYAIRLELHDVEAFEPGSPVPRQTRMMTNVIIRADDPKALERKKGWGFPSEQGKDFELSLLPALEHQSLFRLYRHDQSTLWSTLMVHTEARLVPMPPALAAKAGSQKGFKSFLTHTIVCELLHEPDLKMTSTYIEPDDPPSTAWIDRETVKAPWSAGKAALEPARGSLVFTDGRMRFLAFSEEARLAAAELARAAREQGLPSQSLQWEKDAGGKDDLDLEAAPEPEGH